MATVILSVEDRGDDVLVVRGTVEVAVEARGWLSAMTNHYGPGCYDPGGNLLKDAVSREMTEAEKHAYLVRLLEGAAPSPLGSRTAPRALSLPSPGG